MSIIEADAETTSASDRAVADTSDTSTARDSRGSPAPHRPAGRRAAAPSRSTHRWREASKASTRLRELSAEKKSITTFGPYSPVRP